jgi:hypothetical protein
MIGSWDSAFSIVTRVWTGQSGVQILVGATDIFLLQNYAGSSVATSRASHVGLVKGDDPDKKGYPDPPGWGLWHESKNLNLLKNKKYCEA